MTRWRLAPGTGETIVRVTGLVLSATMAFAIAWALVSQPRTLADVRGGLAASVGAYRIDQEAFDEGLRFFRDDRFAEARSALARADPASRDPVTQYYVAYAYYRQGWGRLFNDDELFGQAMMALDRAVEASPGGVVRVDDPGLGLRSSDELRAELERGLTRDASDLNPARLFRARQ